jgi:hypothetical protein
MTLLRQELNTDMAHSMKSVLAEFVNLMTSKPPPSAAVIPELIERSVQQALEKNQEICSIKNQLGR